MTIETSELGLRERKRIATRRSIQLAAIGLVADNGLERLTIDEIGRVADISPRTFFNYFPTKEAALIGDTPTMPTSEAVDDFVSAGPGESVLLGIEELLIEGSENVAEDHELTQRRREVLKQHPQLFAMRMLTMKSFEEELRLVVAQRLKRDNPGLDAETVLSRSRLTTLVAAAAMRHAWTCWADDGGVSDLTSRLRESFSELHNLLASTPTR
jgi:AcrR family transcriptional regulator